MVGEGKDHAGVGGADHVPELGRGREADVLRDVGGARLQDAEQADEHRDRAEYEEADVVAGPYTLADQAGGEGVRVPVELAVGDRGTQVFGGDGVRGGGGLPFDSVVDQRVGEDGGGAAAVLPEKVLVAGWQVAQGHDGKPSWLIRDGLLPIRDEYRACPVRRMTCRYCAASAVRGFALPGRTDPSSDSD